MPKQGHLGRRGHVEESIPLRMVNHWNLYTVRSKVALFASLIRQRIITEWMWISLDRNTGEVAQNTFK
jgi:hypothetical protein